VEAIHIGNLLCQHGYFFPVGECKNLVVKDDSSLYRFQVIVTLNRVFFFFDRCRKQYLLSIYYFFTFSREVSTVVASIYIHKISIWFQIFGGEYLVPCVITRRNPLGRKIVSIYMKLSRHLYRRKKKIK